MDDIDLSTYFAVQSTRYETSHDVAKAVMMASKTAQVLFRRLESLDTMSVGTSTFIRFRADLGTPRAVFGALLAGGRGVIECQGKTYVVKLPGGRSGPMNTLTMHAEPKPGNQRMYRGTKIKSWEDQFSV
jgi:hypothetical protein